MQSQNLNTTVWLFRFWTTRPCDLSKYKNNMPLRNEIGRVGQWTEECEARLLAKTGGLAATNFGARAPQWKAWQEIWAGSGPIGPIWASGVSVLFDNLSLRKHVNGSEQNQQAGLCHRHTVRLGWSWAHQGRLLQARTLQARGYRAGIMGLQGLEGWSQFLSPVAPQAWPHRHTCLQNEHPRKERFLLFLDCWWQITKGVFLIGIHVCTGLCKRERQRQKEGVRETERGRDRERRREGHTPRGRDRETNWERQRQTDRQRDGSRQARQTDRQTAKDKAEGDEEYSERQMENQFSNSL